MCIQLSVIDFVWSCARPQRNKYTAVPDSSFIAGETSTSTRPDLHLSLSCLRFLTSYIRTMSGKGKGERCTAECQSNPCQCGEKCQCGEGCNCADCKTCRCTNEGCKCGKECTGPTSCKCGSSCSCK